jgi:hypothetical protein
VGRVYEPIDVHRRWVAKQPLFFVGSALLDWDGHVNVSPNGPIGTAAGEAYVARKNAESIDGLPAFEAETEPTQA